MPAAVGDISSPPGINGTIEFAKLDTPRNYARNLLHTKSASANKSAPVPRSRSATWTRLAFPPRSFGEPSRAAFAFCSPGSQKQVSVPHGEQKLPFAVCPAMATVANGSERMSLLRFEAEKQIGSASMHTAAINSLILTDLSSFNQLTEPAKGVSRTKLYQEIAHSFLKAVQTYQEIDDVVIRLAGAADHAYAFRDLNVVNCIGRALIDIPSAQQLGSYYLGLALSQGGRGDVNRAGSLFEQVASRGSLHFRARAMLALGTNCYISGNLGPAMSFYRDVLRIAMSDRDFDPVTAYFASQMSAVVRSMDGNNRGALADLERMLPLARAAGSVQPFAYYDYLNSLAVEQCEAGSLEQAKRASETALRSPYARAYPNWQETFEEIEYKQRRASRSVVAVPKQVQQPEDTLPQQRRRANTAAQRRPLATPHLAYGDLKESGNLVLLPVAKRAASPATDEANGRVLAFQKKRSVFDKPNHLQPRKLTREQMYELTTPQKLMRIVDLISRDETDDEMIDRMLEAVEEIALGDPEGQVS